MHFPCFQPRQQHGINDTRWLVFPAGLHSFHNERFRNCNCTAISEPQRFERHSYVWNVSYNFQSFWQGDGCCVDPQHARACNCNRSFNCDDYFGEESTTGNWDCCLVGPRSLAPAYWNLIDFWIINLIKCDPIFGVPGLLLRSQKTSSHQGQGRMLLSWWQQRTLA